MSIPQKGDDGFVATAAEMDSLSQAMKDPKFRDLLAEYVGPKLSSASPLFFLLLFFLFPESLPLTINIPSQPFLNIVGCV